MLSKQRNKHITISDLARHFLEELEDSHNRNESTWSKCERPADTFCIRREVIVSIVCWDIVRCQECYHKLKTIKCQKIMEVKLCIQEDFKDFLCTDRQNNLRVTR